MQSEAVAHSTHSPLLVPDKAQAEKTPEQSELAVQPRQISVEGSQIGVGFEQSLSDWHPPHMPVSRLHAGVAPVHCDESVALHWTQ